MAKVSLFKRIYKIVRDIPKGKVATYGQIAQIAGIKDARKVGWALHQNKDHHTPCHRVVNKKGGLAASFAFGGKKEQEVRLSEEGITFKDNLVDLKKHLWQKRK